MIEMYEVDNYDFYGEEFSKAQIILLTACLQHVNT